MFPCLVGLLVGGMFIVAASDWPDHAIGAELRDGASLNPAAERIDEIAGMLPARPVGIGRPASDRRFWRKVAGGKHAAEVLAEASRELGRPIPEVTAEDFDSYSKTGRRGRYAKAMGKLLRRYSRAVFAECIDNRGRFVADIERCIRALCLLPTWVPPYHNGLWRRKESDSFIVDLSSSDCAATLATGDYWLGGKIDASVRKELLAALRRRIFTPMRTQVEGKPGRHIWWLKSNNNWNSVCHAGVVVAALSTLPDRRERAFFIAAAEKSMRYYLDGFTDDGYCSEGLSYWNYGFSNYVMLSDTVFMATGGKLDWMAKPKVRTISLFATRMEMLPGVYPAIGDASPHVKPMGSLQNYVTHKYKLGLSQWQRPTGPAAMRPGMVGIVFATPAGVDTPVDGPGYKPDKMREWFDQAQFYIGRPGKNGSAGMAVACKGGSNGEHHNHNDVGTYVVALAGQCPLIDPGAPVYTRKTFSSERYTDNVINSWGHPVPLVAGKLQRTGAEAKAVVLEKSFTDAQDKLVLDIKAAYDVPQLESLTRTFIYSRRGKGSLTVTDQARFTTPSRFGTALITYGDWRRNKDGSITVTDQGQSLRISIDAAGRAYHVNADKIDSEVRMDHKPLRIGIDLDQPGEDARITIDVTPGE